MLLVAWWSCVCVVYRWCMRARACWRGYATSPCCYVWKAGPCGSAESTQVCAVLSTVGQGTPRHRVPTAETKWRVTRMLFGKLFFILSMNLSSQHDHPEWMWSRSGWGKGGINLPIVEITRSGHVDDDRRYQFLIVLRICVCAQQPTVPACLHLWL